jgi:hypothetical protein
MYEVHSDAGRNRLYITLAGHMDSTERQATIKAILTEAANLEPGFGVVTDISGLFPSDQEGFKDLLRAKSGLRMKGAGPIIRVVKIPLSRIQVERISEAAGYEAESVSSIEAADRRLDVLQAEAKPEP